MVNKILDIISEDFGITKNAIGGFEQFKAPPLKVKVNSYSVKELGSVCIMESSAMLGFMKMITVVINADKCDIPLFSCDFISAFGKYTLLVEYYDREQKGNKSEFLPLYEIKETIKDIQEYDLGEHWYDDMKIDCSLSKRSGKKALLRMKHALEKSLYTYLEIAKNTKKLSDVERKKKQKSVKEYVDGLFEQGSPSADIFTKAIGKDKAYEFFSDVVFGVKL